MFNIGLPELLIIAAIALIVFGPNKLPELAKAFGRAMREFRKATEEVKESFEAETRDLEELKNDLAQENLLADLAEEVNTSIEPPGEPSAPAEENGPSEASTSGASASTETSPKETTLTPEGNDKVEKGEEAEGVKEGTPSHG